MCEAIGEPGLRTDARFAEPLKKLEAEGWLKMEGDRVSFTRDALLQADRLIHAFFLPQHLGARYT